MTVQVSTQISARSTSQLNLIAWVGTLLASYLTNILWKELFSGDMVTGFYIRIGFALVLLLLSHVWPASRPLRGYWWIILVLAAGDVASAYLLQAPAWNSFWSSGTSWFVTSLGGQLPRLFLTLFAWLALVLMGLKPKDYYLATGRLDAPNEPARWLGEKKSRPWTEYGRQWTVTLFIVTLVVLGWGIRPSLHSLGQIIPLLPAVLLFAALNAFNENFAYRAALLPHLVPICGKGQPLLLTALFFGLGHFYGIPPGIGAILPTFLGWVCAKAMLETKGFFWSWMIQFPLDVLIMAVFAARFVSGS